MKYLKLTLKALRINKNLTQAEAAKRLGISEFTLNNYENYKSYPDVPVIERILKLYNANYDNIIFLPQDCNLNAKIGEKEDTKESE